MLGNSDCRPRRYLFGGSEFAHLQEFADGYQHSHYLGPWWLTLEALEFSGPSEIMWAHDFLRCFHGRKHPWGLASWSLRKGPVLSGLLVLTSSFTAFQHLGGWIHVAGHLVGDPSHSRTAP